MGRATSASCASTGFASLPAAAAREAQSAATTARLRERVARLAAPVERRRAREVRPAAPAARPEPVIPRAQRTQVVTLPAQRTPRMLTAPAVARRAPAAIPRARTVRMVALARSQPTDRPSAPPRNAALDYCQQYETLAKKRPMMKSPSVVPPEIGFRKPTSAARASVWKRTP